MGGVTANRPTLAAAIQRLRSEEARQRSKAKEHLSGIVLGKELSAGACLDYAAAIAVVLKAVERWQSDDAERAERSRQEGIAATLGWTAALPIDAATPPRPTPADGKGAQ